MDDRLDELLGRSRIGKGLGRMQAGMKAIMDSSLAWLISNCFRSFC